MEGRGERGIGGLVGDEGTRGWGMGRHAGMRS